jgi:hypothetical protein
MADASGIGRMNAFALWSFEPAAQTTFGGSTAPSPGSLDPTSKPLTDSFGYLPADGSAAGAIFSSS